MFKHPYRDRIHDLAATHVRELVLAAAVVHAVDRREPCPGVVIHDEPRRWLRGRPFTGIDRALLVATESGLHALVLDGGVRPRVWASIGPWAWGTFGATCEPVDATGSTGGGSAGRPSAPRSIGAGPAAPDLDGGPQRLTLRWPGTPAVAVDVLTDGQHAFQADAVDFIIRRSALEPVARRLAAAR